MRQLTLATAVPGIGADEAFGRVTDVVRFPAHAPDIRSVEVHHDGDGRTSSWEVKFRGGTMRWVERDDLDDVGRRMAFRMVEGDFTSLEGEWAVEPRDGVAVVRFRAAFDLSVGGIGAVVEPIAAKSLRTNLTAVLHGLFGDVTVEADR